MKNQTSFDDGKGECNQMVNDKNYTSKDMQTDLYGDEVEKLLSFQSKYFDKQLELDTNLR